jgi:glycosyltransferase involved in cell wall biosynthesis
MQTAANMPTSNDSPPILLPRLSILHIISGDLWAGAETQAYTLLKSLKGSCKLHVVLMNDGELANRLRQTGITVEIIDERTTSGIGITRRLISIIKSIKPDLIHTHRQKENILASIANLAANIIPWRRIKSLRTTHGAPEHNATGLKKIIIWLDRILGIYAQDAVISVSNDLARKLIKTFPAHHIHTIENGIDIDTLKQQTPAPDIRKDAEDYLHIGIVGRLEPVKRIDLFIRTAHQLLNDQNPQKLRFHVIGDGKLKSELIALAIELDLANKILFHGHRSDSTAAIAALDIIVMCSDHEGTPMTALETLALGKPLVAHNVGGLSEVLADYPQLLVDNHCADGYSTHLRDLFRTPIRPQLKPIYTSTENAQKTLQLYLRITHKNVE